ncbi:hypothetical protein D1007_40144 [Hordeum vulgare]|nr:hypothetical protein D1007_40144 [Hordeum vulgare]
MEGIPPNVWSRATAQIMLGAAAWLERLGTPTANRGDLGSFEAFVWTDDPSLIPREKLILVEESGAAMEVELCDGQVLPADALVPVEKILLEYKADPDGPGSARKNKRCFPYSRGVINGSGSSRPSQRREVMPRFTGGWLWIYQGPYCRGGIGRPRQARADLSPATTPCLDTLVVHRTERRAPPQLLCWVLVVMWQRR